MNFWITWVVNLIYYCWFSTFLFLGFCFWKVELDVNFGYDCNMVLPNFVCVLHYSYVLCWIWHLANEILSAQLKFVWHASYNPMGMVGRVYKFIACYGCLVLHLDQSIRVQIKSHRTPLLEIPLLPNLTVSHFLLVAVTVHRSSVDLYFMLESELCAAPNSCWKPPPSWLTPLPSFL